MDKKEVQKTISSQLSADLKQRYQDTEEMNIFKDNIKDLKYDISIKIPKPDKVIKMQNKIKEADGKIVKRKVQDSLLKEVKENQLTKYTSDLAQTIVECQLHQTNIKFFVELCMTLQVYEDFTPNLLKFINKQIEQLDQKGGNYENEAKRALKRKNLLRLVSELHQLLISNDQFIELFKALLPMQGLEFMLSNVKVLSNFMQHFGFAYFGQQSAQLRKDLQEEPSIQEIFRPKKSPQLENFVKKYIQHLEEQLIELHASIVEKSTDNQQSINDATDDPKIKELKEQFLLLKDAYRIILDCFGKYDANNKIQQEIQVLDLYNKDFEYAQTATNEDCFNEDEKRLYTQFVNITQVMEASQNKKECSSIDAADLIAMEFINSKPNRKKLLDDIINFKQNYIVLLPYQCRLIATLCKHYKDFEEEVTKAFVDAYKQTKPADHTDRKNRFIRYICELTKFRVLKQDIILDIFQQLLEDFINQNIELVALILENCGRFLKHSQESSRRFQFQLEQLAKIRASKPLAQQQESQLDNALLKLAYQTKILKQKSDLQLYIKYLLFEQLDQIDVLIQNLLMLPLSVKACQDYLVKQLIKVIIKGRFSSLRLVAGILALLKLKYPEITGQVVDALIEDIQCGLEDNSVILRQRRITIIRMLGELYIYQLINKDVLFQILYLLIEYGHESSISRVDQDIIDPPDDSFRINQILNLIDAVKEYQKPLRNQIVQFLIHFQRYVLSKQYLPQIVEFSILDLYETIEPKLAKIKTLKQAEQLCLKQDQNIDDLLNSIQELPTQTIERKMPLDDNKDSMKQIEQEFEQQLNKVMNEFHSEASLKSNMNQANTSKKPILKSVTIQQKGTDKKIIQRQEAEQPQQYEKPQPMTKKKLRLIQSQQLSNFVNFQ